MNKFKSTIASLLLILSVSACSTTDLLKAGAGALGVSTQEPMVGIETEVGDDTVVMGDAISPSTTFDDVEGDVRVSNNNTKNKIEEAEQVVVNENMSPFAIMLIAFLSVFAALGWMLPSYAEMRKHVKNRTN